MFSRLMDCFNPKRWPRRKPAKEDPNHQVLPRHEPAPKVSTNATYDRAAMHLDRIEEAPPQAPIPAHMAPERKATPAIALDVEEAATKELWRKHHPRRWFFRDELRDRMYACLDFLRYYTWGFIWYHKWAIPLCLVFILAAMIMKGRNEV